jgi:hypothetical protein
MSETPQAQPQPPEQRSPEGIVAAVAHFAKGLTLTNVLAIGALAVVLVPSYLLWRLLNDESMLGRVLSSYEEKEDKSGCTLRIASLRGAGDTYAISTGFAAQGADQWVISVIMSRTPSETDINSYCETLQRIVDHMRRPDQPPPTYPGTDIPLIWRYPANGSP